METIEITKIDDQYGIKFPLSVSDKLGMREGQSLKIITFDDRIDLKFADGTKLDSMLDKINPENLHKEFDTSEQVGNEVW